ncbi:MAG: LPS export ABC transporter periplasmic protein LptC [Bacteroidales bacterium]|nr:LPS export ABC transporter periplasmic protein LptC [Bacteroidales bacterium]
MKTSIKNITAIFVGVMFFVSCSDNFKKNELLQANNLFPDESTKEMKIIYSDSGKLVFEIYAPIVNTYQGDKNYMDCPAGVTITSYNDWGEKQSIMTADYAISNDKTQTMEARDNVVIVNLLKQEKIETSQIMWDKRAKRIYSKVQVRQTKADGTVNIGEGFTADERFTKYTVFKPVAEVLANEL